jgi:hypothetical protein
MEVTVFIEQRRHRYFMKQRRDRRRVFFVVMLLLVYTCAGCTQKPVPPVNRELDGLAIKGFDPVAYFTEGKPLQGLPEYETVWKGATWRFVNDEHRTMFIRSPEQYAPRYGGYCAYAVSRGKTADIDPDAWTIVNHRLYLNLNKDVQGLWDRDRQEYIRKADQNWPHLAGEGA